MPISKMAEQQSKQDRRKGLRVPVYLDASFELSSGTVVKCKVINLATKGVGIETNDPAPTNEKVMLEFLIPGTLTSIRTAGEVIWCHSNPQEHRQNNPGYIAGITFKDLAKDCQIQLLEYILREVLSNEDLLQLNGISQVMSHIRHMPPTYRLKYYRILTNRRIVS